MKQETVGRGRIRAANCCPGDLAALLPCCAKEQTRIVQGSSLRMCAHTPFLNVHLCSHALVLQKHRKLRHQKEGMGLFSGLVCYQPHGAESTWSRVSEFFNTTCQIHRYHRGGGLRKAQELSHWFSLQVPFEEWIAARPQDTLTWEMRELTQRLAQSSLFPVQLCVSH